DVAFDGSNSLDWDAFISNGGWGGGNGIVSYAWALLSQPAACNLPFAAGNTPKVTLYSTGGANIPNPRPRTYNLRPVVTDADQPNPRMAGNSAWATIVNCGAALCIDHPTQRDFAYIDLPEHTDVLIYYHLNNLINAVPVYANNSPYGQKGMSIELIISG